MEVTLYGVTLLFRKQYTAHEGLPGSKRDASAKDDPETIRNFLKQLDDEVAAA
ncbi:MAG: hypothetical protein ACJ789_06850 [Thermomicrobiales bacterium]